MAEKNEKQDQQVPCPGGSVSKIDAFFDIAELIVKRTAALLGTFLSETEHLAFKLAIVILAVLKLMDLINKK